MGRLVVAILLAAGAAAPPVPAAVDREAVLEVAGKLVCYCGTCSNQSVRDCTCGTAASARDEIRTRLERGESPQAILAAFTDRYGEQVLIAPGTQGFNLVAWVTPFIALLVGAGAVVWGLRRWSTAPVASPAAPPAAVAASGGVAADREALERFERELRGYDD